MKQCKIVMKRIGYSNVTLIVNGSSSVIVDTGVKGNLNKIKMMFKQNGLKPEDIRLIILTHTHYDHAGNLLALKKLTGADVAVHKNEFENLKKGYIPIPDGQRFIMQVISRLGKLIIPGFASPKPFTADVVTDSEFDLAPYGIDGKIIHTPGHSSGSQSVVMGKEVIAGDCFMNMIYGVIFPHFAENPQLLLMTWQKLFNMGIEEIYPGHGKKLKSVKAYPAFLKWKRKLIVE